VARASNASRILSAQINRRFHAGGRSSALPGRSSCPPWRDHSWPEEGGDKCSV